MLKLTVRRNLISIVSLMIGFCPSGSFGKDAPSPSEGTSSNIPSPSQGTSSNAPSPSGGSDSNDASRYDKDKVAYLQQDLCAPSAQTDSPEISEKDSNTQGDVCVACTLERDSVVDLRKIVKSLAEEARIKREIEFLRYYAKRSGFGGPEAIARMIKNLDFMKKEKASAETRLANSKSENETYAKNEIALRKLVSGEELSKEERLSLAALLKDVQSEGGAPPQLYHNTKDKIESDKNGFTDKVDSPMSTEIGTEGQSAPKGLPQNLKQMKKKLSTSLLESHKKSHHGTVQEGGGPVHELFTDRIKKWLEAGDLRPLDDVPTGYIANILLSVNEDRFQTQHLPHQIENLAHAIQDAEQKLEILKKQLAAFDKIAASKSYTRAELAELEKEYKDKLYTRKPPGWKDCGLTLAESLALQDYTEQGYRALNNALRAGGKAAQEMEPYTETLKAALKKFKNFRGAVRRGVELPPEVLNDHQEGSTISYAAFTSTGVTEGFRNRHQFIIVVRNGAYVGPHSTSPNEEEVVIPPGKFKVLSRQPGPNGRVEFVLEQLEDK